MNIAQLANYRYQMLGNGEIKQHLPEDQLTGLDYVLDTTLRELKGLPSRPHGSKPYEGIFTLPAHLKPAIEPLENYKGNFELLKKHEGFVGRPYRPNTALSGITLDYGIDLGYQRPDKLKVWYPHLNDDQIKRLSAVCGLKGMEAQSKLPTVQDIRITRAQATITLPVVAKTYWNDIRKRFPNLNNAPSYVQEVMLSIAYNRGAHNRGLNILKVPIAQSHWYSVATHISNMQQDHPAVGIRRRRKEEAMHILTGIKKGTA